MKSLPTAPAPGTPVSSSLIRELIAAVRARTILRGKGYRVRETPAGTSLEIDTPPAAKFSRLPGLFEPKLETDDGEIVVTFAYPYYMVGSRLYRVEDEYATVRLPSGSDGGISYLSVSLDGDAPYASCGVASTFSRIQQLANGPGVSIKPLYEHGKGGIVVRDFRNMPTIATREFST